MLWKVFYLVPVMDALMNADRDSKAPEGQQVTEQLEERYEWELLGAEEKAQSIIQLTDELGIRSILETGTGTGAPLETLDKLGFTERY